MRDEDPLSPTACSLVPHDNIVRHEVLQLIAKQAPGRSATWGSMFIFILGETARGDHQLTSPLLLEVVA
jgi:hypothetical protein